ncbi:glycoside hydrolase family 53 protein [Carboxylicivirga sp. N1Y90]|uniref:glycoside hydrolase family 53 protein n=1 Tax=Carboxylicivirga fragile TaxID=3417571 RepID=UPI003D353D00|nr:glycosyl hydrolase 53 family protein [Marinilabiliaceae bacterium N1Y90]
MRNDFLLIAVLLAGLIGMSSSCTKEKPVVEDEPPIPPETIDFVHGIDLSYVKQVEDKGGVFKLDQNNIDPFKLFKDKGANMVRLRLWHNPEWIKDIYGDQTAVYSGFEEVAIDIKRAKDNGMAVNLDFHYSDIWADPEHQTPPSAWMDITDINVLCDSVYNYTYGVMKELHERNILPEMVQIGNETNCGMMHTGTMNAFPKLSVCDGNWINMGKVLNAGIKAVRDVDMLSGKSTLVALHVADPKNLDWWFTNIINQGQVTDFDIAGFSYYHIWHTTVSFFDLPDVVISLKAKINRDVVILETAYPFTTDNNDSYNNIYGSQAPLAAYPYSVEGQKQYMIDLTQNMMEAGAIGVMYWEPAWITSGLKDLWGTGSAWENCALFDFSGKATDGINYLNHPFTN